MTLVCGKLTLNQPARMPYPCGLTAGGKGAGFSLVGPCPPAQPYYMPQRGHMQSSEPQNPVLVRQKLGSEKTAVDRP